MTKLDKKVVIYATIAVKLLNTKDQLLGSKCNNNPIPPRFVALIDPRPLTTYHVMTTPFNQSPQHTVSSRHVARFGRAGCL
jgi:hypothetical protein